MIEKEERRLRFLEEDEEMFGLTPFEEKELNKLREKNNECRNNKKRTNN